MTAPLKSRTFGGMEGKKAAGEIQGPEPIKNDFDNVFAALNPLANFKTGEAGGLQENNLHSSLLALIKSIMTINNIAGDVGGNLTLQAGTGIKISASGNTIQITATGDMAPASHAISHIKGGTDELSGTLAVDVEGNVIGNADSATNVTTHINGHAITDILESDGVTAKKATSSLTANLADAAKGNTRWQVSSAYISLDRISVAPASSIIVGHLWCYMPAGKNLVLKGAKFYTGSFDFLVQGRENNWSAGSLGDKSDIDCILIMGSPTNVTQAEVVIKFVNSSTTTFYMLPGNYWWLDLAYEDIV